MTGPGDRSAEAKGRTEVARAWFRVRFGGNGHLSWEVFVGRDCFLTLEARPPHCDRGRWYAKVFPRIYSSLALSLDEQDGFPRYYFDRERAILELEAWLKRRGQFQASPRPGQLTQLFIWTGEDVLVDCPHCEAPLAPSDLDEHAVCRYCGNALEEHT